MENLTYVTGQRGAPKLIVGGYSFIRNKGNFKVTYWRCSKTRSHQCRAKVVTNQEHNTVFVTNANHNHPPDYSQYINST